MNSNVQDLCGALPALKQFSKELNSLADRGIILSPWQANKLYLGGRGLGRTFLSYVKLAESCKGDGFSLSLEHEFSNLDPDADSEYRKQQWLRGLKDFLEEYYSDTYTVTTYPKSGVKATPLKNSSRRWWNNL